MELTPIGDVPLWVWIDGRLGLFEGVAYTFHEGDYFHGLNVEVVFQDLDMVGQSCWTVVKLNRWSIEGTSAISRCSPRYHRVGFKGT